MRRKAAVIAAAARAIAMATTIKSGLMIEGPDLPPEVLTNAPHSEHGCVAAWRSAPHELHFILA
jgi:hypothetical protein